MYKSTNNATESHLTCSVQAPSSATSWFSFAQHRRPAQERPARWSFRLTIESFSSSFHLSFFFLCPLPGLQPSSSLALLFHFFFNQIAFVTWTSVAWCCAVVTSVFKPPATNHRPLLPLPFLPCVSISALLLLLQFRVSTTPPLSLSLFTNVTKEMANNVRDLFFFTELKNLFFFVHLSLLTIGEYYNKLYEWTGDPIERHV